MTTALIHLTDVQTQYGTWVGMERYRLAIENNLKEGNNGERSLKKDIMGALAEMAFYVYAQPIQWNDVINRPGGRIKGIADFAGWIDAKAVERASDRLLIQFEDDPNWAYPLVRCGEAPTYELSGWVWGRDIMKEQHKVELQAGRPCYGYKGRLRPMSELFDLIRKDLRDKVRG